MRALKMYILLLLLLLNTINTSKTSTIVFFTDLQVSIISTGCDDPGPHRSRGIKCSLARCSIQINKKEMSLKGRGMNVVALSQMNAHVLARKQFDIAKSVMEAEKMAKFLDSLPLGTVVLGAVKDDAFKYFHEKKLKVAMVSLRTCCQSVVFACRMEKQTDLGQVRATYDISWHRTKVLETQNT